jgi:hypothetical protein
MLDDAFRDPTRLLDHLPQEPFDLLRKSQVCLEQNPELAWEELRGLDRVLARVSGLTFEDSRSDGRIEDEAPAVAVEKVEGVIEALGEETEVPLPVLAGRGEVWKEVLGGGGFEEGEAQEHHTYPETPSAPLVWI